MIGHAGIFKERMQVVMQLDDIGIASILPKNMYSR